MWFQSVSAVMPTAPNCISLNQNYKFCIFLCAGADASARTICLRPADMQPCMYLCDYDGTDVCIGTERLCVFVQTNMSVIYNVYTKIIL